MILKFALNIKDICSFELFLFHVILHFCHLFVNDVEGSFHKSNTDVDVTSSMQSNN